MKYPNIEAERARLGLTKKELADKLGVSTKTLNNWQSGESDIPASKMAIMAKLFRVSAYYLLGRTCAPERS